MTVKTIISLWFRDLSYGIWLVQLFLLSFPKVGLLYLEYYYFIFTKFCKNCNVQTKEKKQ